MTGMELFEELMELSKSMYRGAQQITPIFVSVALIVLAWYLNAIAIAAALGVFLFFEALGYGFIVGEALAKAKMKKGGGPDA